MSMAKKSAWRMFKSWATSHSMHQRGLPFRLSVRANEELVDFIHGNIIGLLLGFLVGLLTLKVL